MNSFFIVCDGLELGIVEDWSCSRDDPKDRDGPNAFFYVIFRLIREEIMCIFILQNLVFIDFLLSNSLYNNGIIM